MGHTTALGSIKKFTIFLRTVACSLSSGPHKNNRVSYHIELDRIDSFIYINGNRDLPIVRLVIPCPRPPPWLLLHLPTLISF